ncbi:hypothetical protein BK128_04670 [Viridibacillus sp. FSL H7-0596]|uniref:hypothetical protein n=1 Tax=Viridibacillus sp. FSL H7-0596 TaxID=1928923 RepID=UPI00096C5F14|nr:hypothetical protein [Viridibacillus sp. FSL H7-0596]OMC89220.1 hypothetical protein BK128_04670 [Viridibacillus sp. FSL H7-0596]
MKSRTFKGVSNVLPTAITNLTPSVQGVIGKQVTVKTQVDVPAGQSKEGIAVTFSIANSADTSVGNFGKKIVAEAFTDANGVASYSYTQYVSGTEDTVEAYPTGNASVKSTAAIVYWGNTERLTVTDVTTGASFANGSKKVYKIKAQDYATAYLADGKTVDYKYVNVTFAENVNVTPDKLVTGAKVVDTNLPTFNNRYPYQVTTGGKEEIRVKLDANGEATFTVTGENAAVTPIVFVDKLNAGKLDVTELQATASKVTFSLNHTLGLSVVAAGQQNAASITTNGEGGRAYTATITDKDGKLAPANTVAYVTFEKGNLGDKLVKIDGVTVESGKSYPIKVTGTKGEAEFVLTGNKDGFAKPTVYLDNGKTNGSLDTADLQTVAETTYFVNAVVQNSSLEITNDLEKVATSVNTGEWAKFTYSSLDQNGFDYFTGTNGDYEVTFQITAQFGDVTGTTSDGRPIHVSKGNTLSYVVKAQKGKANVKVKSDVASTIGVQASASQTSLPNQTASVNVVSQVISVYAGEAVTHDAKEKLITIKGTTGNKVFSYAGADFYDKNNKPVSETDFKAALIEGVKVTYKKSGDTVQFFITADGSGNPLTEKEAVTPPTTVTGTKVDTGSIEVAEKLAKYTSGTITGTYGDYTLDINGTLVTVSADSSAAEVAAAINAKTITGITAKVSGNQVVIDAAASTDIDVKSGNTTFFGNAVKKYEAKKDAVKGKYTYDFTGKTIVAGDKVVVNGITYTAATSTKGTNFTVGADIDATVTELAKVVSVNDTKLEASYASKLLTLEEVAGFEAKADFSDIKITK